MKRRCLLVLTVWVAIFTVLAGFICITRVRTIHQLFSKYRGPIRDGNYLDPKGKSSSNAKSIIAATDEEENGRESERGNSMTRNTENKTSDLKNNDKTTLHHETNPREDSSPKAFGIRKKEKKYFLIYNNVPKCGSRSLSHTINDLFKHRRMNRVEKSDSTNHDYLELQKAFKKTKAPAYISGHMPFISPKYRSDMIYINMVRDPVDRFVSMFYFARNGDAKGVKPSNAEKLLKNQTIDDYIRAGGVVRGNEIFYYFLENKPIGKNFTSTDALQEAKANIDRYYTLVGLTEEIHATMILLGKLLPNVLHGLPRVYTNKNKDRRKNYLTLHKVPPSQQTVSVLREKLHYEYELYNFIKERFQSLKKDYNIE